MSFEGYYQILCRNGHIGGADCYDDPNFDGPEQVQVEGVGDVGHPHWRYKDERIDGYVDLELATEPDVCTCECGYVHPKNGELPTYKIPEAGGHIVNGGCNSPTTQS
jgi:hypothetical protein